ncbi:MAG: NADPH2:quinone reductase [Hyphomonadaceae bacterium]|nr:MAG: NADPH2:quinone reductase [Hyphomonadaceae bacterium]
MKAIISEQIGPPETLVFCDVPKPQPKPNEVLVQIKAVGINYFDALIIEDKYQFKPPRPFAPCSEISGVVTELGEGVHNLSVGDRVCANISHGGMTEFAAVSADRCLAIEDTMPFDIAAATFMTYGTSYHALKNRAELKQGEVLLVLGAAGGVGLAAVELGVAMGAKVLAACSSQEKLDIAIKNGASGGVVYPLGPFDNDGKKALRELFKNLGGAKGFDVIYDAVGGDYCEAALRSIAWKGRLLVVGFPSGIPSIPLNLTLLKGCSIVGVFFGMHVAMEPAAHHENVKEIQAFYRNGKISPYISKRFALADGALAIEHLKSRQATGKVVVTI